MLQKRFLGLKEKTRDDITLSSLILLFVVWFGHQATLHNPGKYISPIPENAYAYSQDTSYKIPPLADLPEREANKVLIRKIWGKDAGLGIEIARCESGYRTTAENHNSNGTWDEGVFQINTVHQMPDMLNATANISYAYTIFLKQGTNPWTSSESCWEN